MCELDMRNEPGDHDNIKRSRAHHLIGDVDIAAQRVARLGQCKIAHWQRTPSLERSSALELSGSTAQAPACGSSCPKTSAPSILPARRQRSQARWRSCTRSPRTAVNHRYSAKHTTLPQVLPTTV